MNDDPLPIYGASMLDRLRTHQEALNQLYDFDEMRRRRAAFNALPWWRKWWLLARYRQ